jgi:hypothetical protein
MEIPVEGQSVSIDRRNTMSSVGDLICCISLAISLMWASQTGSRVVRIDLRFSSSSSSQ